MSVLAGTSALGYGLLNSLAGYGNYGGGGYGGNYGGYGGGYGGVPNGYGAYGGKWNFEWFGWAYPISKLNIFFVGIRPGYGGGYGGYGGGNGGYGGGYGGGVGGYGGGIFFFDYVSHLDKWINK